MGYYDNPQIIQPNRSGEVIGSAIANFGQSIAQGLNNTAEIIRAKEKEDKLTIEKLQNRKNEIDLAYAEKRSKYQESEVDVNPKVNEKIREILKQSSINSADAQIKLISETDPEKRQLYLDMITKHDSLLDNASKAVKVLGGTVSTYKSKAKSSLIGKPGGYVVNGKDGEIENNIGFLDVVSGMSNADNTKYTEQELDVELDASGTGFNIMTSGVYNEKKFNKTINTRAYVSADDDLDDSLLLNVETMDTFYNEANLEVADKDNNIFKGLLLQTYETVDLNRSNGDQYQLVNAKKLNVPFIESKLRSKAEIKATGILATDNPSSLKAIIDYSLEQGNGTYDKDFLPLKTAKERQDYLTNLLTKKSFERLTAQMERTPNKDGGIDYWDPDATSLQIKEKPRLTKVGGGGNNGGGGNDNNEDSSGGVDYRKTYYDNLRNGIKRKPSESNYNYDLRSREYYAQNLNNLSGSNKKFLTSEQLYKRWLKQPYAEGGTKTLGEEYKSGKLKGRNAIKDFFAEYGKAGLYFEESSNEYTPLSNYNLKTARGRNLLALDFTAGEGTKKKLQETLSESESKDKLANWVKNNPQQQGETLKEYVKRYENSPK